jgi:hypothetical protein
MFTDGDRECDVEEDKRGGSRDVDAGRVRNEEGRGDNSGDDGVEFTGSKQGEFGWDACFSAERKHEIGI